MELIYLTLAIAISLMNICYIFLHVDNVATTFDTVFYCVGGSGVGSAFFFTCFTIAMEMSKATVIGNNEKVEKLHTVRLRSVVGFSVAYSSSMFVTYFAKTGWYLDFGLVIINSLVVVASLCALRIVENQYKLVFSTVSRTNSLSSVNKTLSAKDTVSDDPKIQALQILSKRIRCFRGNCFLLGIMCIYQIVAY